MSAQGSRGEFHGPHCSHARHKSRRKACERPQGADQIRQAFSKRKKGIILKAYQLSRLTDAKVFVFIANEKGSSWAYGSPGFSGPTHPDHLRNLRSMAQVPDTAKDHTEIMDHPLGAELLQEEDAAPPPPPPDSVLPLGTTEQLNVNDSVKEEPLAELTPPKPQGTPAAATSDPLPRLNLTIPNIASEAEASSPIVTPITKALLGDVNMGLAMCDLPPGLNLTDLVADLSDDGSEHSPSSVDRGESRVQRANKEWPQLTDVDALPAPAAMAYPTKTSTMPYTLYGTQSVPQAKYQQLLWPPTQEPLDHQDLMRHISLDNALLYGGGMGGALPSEPGYWRPLAPYLSTPSVELPHWAKGRWAPPAVACGVEPSLGYKRRSAASLIGGGERQQARQRLDSRRSSDTGTSGLQGPGSGTTSSPSFPHDQRCYGGSGSEESSCWPYAPAALPHQIHPGDHLVDIRRAQCGRVPESCMVVTTM